MIIIDKNKFFSVLIRKIGSRKFWVALASAALAFCALFGIDELTSGKVASLISSFGVMAVYILGESMVDAASAKSESGKSGSDDPDLK